MSDEIRDLLSQLLEQVRAVSGSLRGLEARVIDLEHGPRRAVRRTMTIDFDDERPVREVRVIYAEEVRSDETD